MSFAGKCIVVTGAGTGIGAAAARQFLAAGAEVIAVQNVAPAPHASRRVTMNLGDPASIAAACRQLPQHIDILCNIAGMGADAGTAQQVIGVNFVGTRILTEALLTRMPGTGCVLSTGSVASRYWRRDIDLVRQVMAMTTFDQIAPFWAPLVLEHQMSYTLAKAALVTWTLKQASRHAATGPRFLVLHPGFTETPMLQRAFAVANETVRKLAESNNSIAQPEDVAKIAVFFCSDAARVLNGVEITADNALTATINCAEYAL